MSSQTENPLLCPTFSSYTTDRLVEIATKVSNDYKNIIGEEENDDDLFEFASSLEELDSPVVHQSSIFPVFNRQLLDKCDETDKKIEKLDDSVLVVPLKTLFMEEERENRISTSSDESESEAPEPYCMWRRKSIGSSPSPSSCKKSKSTGSVVFKRFKICDLLRRSNSEGKDSYLRAPKIDKSSNKIDYRKSPRYSVEVTGKAKAGFSPHELFYVQNRSIKEGDKRKSYLPYRKDLIGFFSILGRAFRT